MSNRKTPIVRYNVGGRVFEVSRNLIECHPGTRLAALSALVSAWDTNEVVFMDGNSDRFGYVLDYLRTGQVVLPSTIPKAAVLKDLRDYGFGNIPPNAVVADSACMDTMNGTMNLCTRCKQDSKRLGSPKGVYGASAGTVMEAMNLCDQYKEDMKTLDAEIARLQYKRSCLSVAQECFHCYMKNGVAACSPISFDFTDPFAVDDLCFRNFNETVFNEQLALYGLYLIRRQTANQDYSVHQLWLGKLSEKDQAQVPEYTNSYYYDSNYDNDYDYYDERLGW